MTVDINVITENLAELLTNTVNMTSVYYDIFLNPEPMDVELKQFNKDNELVTVIIPNRAKDRSIALTGIGSPEGSVSAVVGTAYVDTASSAIYFKAHGTGPNGWSVVLTQEGAQAYIRKYLSDNDFLNKSDLELYLTNNDYIDRVKLNTALETFTPVEHITEAPSEGIIPLKDNSKYYLTPTGDLTFILPTVTDLSKRHNILVQLDLTEPVNIDLGTTTYFDRIAPSFTTVGTYDIMYEYNNAAGVWVAGATGKTGGGGGGGANVIFRKWGV